MKKKKGKPAWVAPKLKQVTMVDTAGKEDEFNEDSTSGREMLMSSSGSQS